MRRLRENQLDALVGRVYEAALDPSLWRTVLHEISEALGADSAALFGIPLIPHVYYSPGADAAFSWLALEGAQVHNPRPERAMRLGSTGRALTESHLFNEWELKNIPFNAALSKLGFHWEAGGVFAEVDGAPIFFTTQRPSGEEGFGKPELEAMEALFPHLERAAQISSRLWAAKTEGMFDAFERMACGTVLLDVGGKILRMNRRAEELIAGVLSVAEGRLKALHGPSDLNFQEFVGRLITNTDRLKRSASPLSAVLPRPHGRPLAVHGMPIVGQADGLFQRAKAILVIVDPDVNRDAQQTILAQAFNLTAAEIRVALALGRGLDLKDVAEAHSVSLNTVRVQVKSLLAKTDTHRQAELVALISRLAMIPGMRDMDK